MSESTLTIFSTTTITSTSTLTRTLFSVTSVSPISTTALHSPSLHPSTAAHQSKPSLYPYRPSLPLCIIATILFFFAALDHGRLSIYLPARPETLVKHRYMVPLFIAACLSTTGYLIRSISIQKPHTSDLSFHTTSAALILIAPLFACATLYLLLARLIVRCLPCPSTRTPTTPRGTAATINTIRARQTNLQRFLFLSPPLLSIFFIASDVVSFFIQVCGAAIAFNNSQPGADHASRLVDQGLHILLSGLVLQLTTFVIYLVALHLFCLRVRDSATSGFNPCIMKVVVGIWIASGFLLIRITFRLVEFAWGPAGYMIRHEWCLYVFDALPVWIALAVLGWRHPIKWMQQRILSGVGAGAITVAGGHGTKTAVEVSTKSPVVVVRKPVSSGETAAAAREGERKHARRRSRVGFAP